MIAELEVTAGTISQYDIIKEINVISMNSNIHLDLNWTNEKIDQENAPCLRKQDERNAMNAPRIDQSDECDIFYDAEDTMLCSDIDLIR